MFLYLLDFITTTLPDLWIHSCSDLARLLFARWARIDPVFSDTRPTMEMADVPLVTVEWVSTLRARISVLE